MRNVEIHIEELILHGFHPADRQRIGEALEQELVRLASTQGISDGFSDDVHIPLLDGGSFQMGTGGRPETAGAGIARSLHRSINEKGRREAK